jgi:hypothetical protein
MPPTKRSRRASTPSSAASSSSTSPSPPPQKRSRKLSKADTADDGEDDYEAERRRRIAENAALLESLGLGVRARRAPPSHASLTPLAGRTQGGVPRAQAAAQAQGASPTALVAGQRC